MDREAVLQAVRRIGGGISALYPTRREWTLPLTLAVVALLLGLASGTALAHRKSIESWVYYSSSDCTRGSAQLDHGSGSGKTEGFTAAYYWTQPFGNCSFAIDVAKQHLRVKVRLMYWAWWGAWETCYDPGWYYNPHSAWKLTVTTKFSGAPYCGNGYYATKTDSHVKYDSWHGGKNQTGSHFLPA